MQILIDRKGHKKVKLTKTELHVLRTAAVLCQNLDPHCETANAGEIAAGLALMVSEFSNESDENGPDTSRGSLPGTV